ncbi:BREX system serine/threonine kinase PglW [Candidatus Binatia bacterium]|nr:BREX system serine/threonine kinase PglW [Candidatus Binatia bacterium]
MLSDGRWQTITESEFPWERDALHFIRERLPDTDPYRAWANFEFIADNGNIYEVDLLVVTPKGFFLVEIKSRPGVLEGDAHTWTWTAEGKKYSYDNPLILADRKAKKLKSLLTRQKACQKIRVPFLQPVVFCSAPDLRLQLNPAAQHNVYARDREAAGDQAAWPGILAALMRWTPGGPDDPADRRIDKPRARALTRAVDEAGIRPSQRSRRVGDYVLGALLAEGPGYQDWEARHASLSTVRRRVRIYPMALGLGIEARDTLRRAAQREFQILEGIHHPGVLRAVDYREHERGPALVFEHDSKSISLQHFLLHKGATLSVDVRMDLLRQIGDALRYAHERKLFHRALSPHSILVLDPDAAMPKIQVFNWQTATRAAGSTSAMPATTGTAHLSELVDDAALVFLAPEVVAGTDAAGELADVFSLGAIAYHLFTGQPPATSLVELGEKLRLGKGLRISSVLDGAGSNLEGLIQYSTHPEVPNRLDSVDGFLGLLETVEEELTVPAEDGAVDPSEAKTNDRLEGGFVVKRRLGQGSCALALLVERDGHEYVLKVASEPDHNRRLQDEAEILDKLRHQHIVALHETLQIGERFGFLMEKAGDETLAQRLRSEGRLHLEHLERFGEDLLQTVDWLEQQGIPHRDIKPDNIGVTPVGRGDKLHLVLFDFSLSRAPAENIRAGTRPYLDPFLSLRKPPRWDLAAERFAAAMTLYEMATGTLPKWGDGQSDPALLDCEATLDTALFDPDLREPMTEFFRTALRRDPRERFDNCEEMLKAWRRVFAVGERQPHVTETDRAAELEAALAPARPETQVALLSLSTRALNALDRMNIVTVADLLAVPVVDLYRMRGIGNKTRRELGTVFANLSTRFPELATGRMKPVEKDPDADEVEAPSVDVLAQQLLPAKAGEPSSEARAIRLLLGLDEPAEGFLSPWPNQNDVASQLKLTRGRVSQLLVRARERWSRNRAFTRLRTDIAALVESNGGVMAAEELAAALLATRGSARVDPLRTRQALAVTRAAVEVERDAQEPRVAVRRAVNRVFVAASQEMADYAQRLGAVADEMAVSDPIAAPARVLETLRAVPTAAGTVLSDSRLVQLAAVASSTAAVSSRLELYPRGMDPQRALRLAYGALLGTSEVTVEQIRERIRGRYPAASDLPDRPRLDELVREAGWDFEWSAERNAYRSKVGPFLATTSGTSSLTRYSTSPEGIVPFSAEVADARQFEERLQHAVKHGDFLVLTVRPRDLQLADDVLSTHFPVERTSLETLLIDEMHAQAAQLHVDWSTVLRADAAARDSRDWENLLRLVGRCLPAIEARLRKAERPLLLVYPGLLVRYGRLDLVERLKESLGRTGGVPGLWLLVPSGEPHAMPVLDGKPIPIITPGQWATIPEPWLRNLHRASVRA